MQLHGTSLVVQWLGPCTSTAGAWVQPLAGELRSCKLHGVAQTNPHPKKNVDDTAAVEQHSLLSSTGSVGGREALALPVELSLPLP